MRKEFREVSVFFCTVMFLSFFVFWGPIAFFKIPTISFAVGPVGPIWAIIPFIIGGFVPSLVGIGLTAVYEGRKGVRELLRSSVQVGIGGKWFLFILTIAAYYTFSLILLNVVTGQSFDYAQFWLQLPTLLPLIILGPVSEEFGWRGFAIKRMLKLTSANTTSLVIGLIWSLWHLPLFYAVGSSQFELGMPFLPFLLSVTSSSFIYTYVYLRTNRSVFSAIFFHWVYTYALTVVSSGITRTSLYNWLECVPAVLIGLVFALIMGKSRSSTIEGADKVS
ncbi:MAG: CPBP family intramembrane metalloprotease [Firmicutes bacterium]|nr:CPBP family intramembrane metalloprotease [Bacillota bacterium]